MEGGEYSLSKGSFTDLFPPKLAETEGTRFFLYISLRNSESTKSKISLSLKGGEKEGEKRGVFVVVFGVLVWFGFLENWVFNLLGF